jgi:peptidyl-prolyl cis-trans isomerase SurA
MSELLIPNAERGDAETAELAENLSNSIKSRAGFEAAARKYSRSPSARIGGKLDWVEIANLPPILSGQILALEEGEVSAPISLSGAVGLFQLRGIREVKKKDLAPITMSYVQVPIPASIGDSAQKSSAAQSILNSVDTCADLRAESERFGKDAFADHTLGREEIPGVLVATLANLDRNEATIAKLGDSNSIVMLCNRIRDIPDEDRDGLRNALINQRISGFGNGYLQELKGKAFIQEQ